MTYIRALAWLIAASVLAATAMGQATPTGQMVLGAEGANILMVAQAPAVQKELNLTDKQKTDLFELVKQSNMKGADLFRAAVLGGGNDPQGMMAAWMKFRQENEQQLAKLLEPKQNERISQLVYRIEGPLSVARQEVSAKLKLSPTQYQQVQDAVDQWRMSQRRLVFFLRQNAAAGQFDPSQLGVLRQQAGMVREAASAQIGKILSRNQKDAFNELLGEPFDLSQIDPSLAGPKSGEAPAPAAEKAKNTRPKKTGNAKGSAKDSGQ